MKRTTLRTIFMPAVLLMCSAAAYGQQDVPEAMVDENGMETAADACGCPFSPTNDVTLDLELGLPLLFPGPLNLFNVYWDDDWDGNPANFRIADIERAMQAVLETTYFDRLCQYGVAGFQFEGSARAAGVCGSDPGPTTTTPGIFSFMSCEENTPFTGVPPAVGLPNPVTCPLCGALPIDCFSILDPLGTAACLATPNPTGNRIYVLFLPKGTLINDFGSVSCTAYEAYHFQIPSRALFSPFPPFVIPGTQGRPINLAIIPTQCFNSISTLMSAVTHEIVEAATDPLPLAHWIDNSTATGTGNFDPARIGSLFTEGENADICGTTSRFTAPDGTTVGVADYWSNHDNACVPSGPVPLRATWVDFGYVGIESGRFEQPFNTLAEGVFAVPDNGTLIFKPGSTPVPATITKRMTLKTCGGTVRIGG